MVFLIRLPLSLHLTPGAVNGRILGMNLRAKLNFAATLVADSYTFQGVSSSRGPRLARARLGSCGRRSESTATDAVAIMFWNLH